jgi:hypothetical protein
MKILEIGYLSLTNETSYSTNFIDIKFVNKSTSSKVKLLNNLVSNLVSLFHECKKADYDIIIVRELARFIYRKECSFIINFARWLIAYYVVWCVSRAKKNSIPVAVIDMVDEMVFDPRDALLLKICDCYFKRELPVNKFNAFARFKPHHAELIDRVRGPEIVEMAAKLRPISLGFTNTKEGVPRIDLESRFQPPVREDEKIYDVFFSGGVDYSSTRAMGIDDLKYLEGLGYNVLILKEHIPIQEFWDLMRKSWITWSPEGLGWDCYRHYEAALVQSVPLINQGGILRYRPLVNNVHALYYEVEERKMLDVITKALEDKDKLLRMSASARQHVLDYHLTKKRGEYVVEETLSTVKKQKI